MIYCLVWVISEDPIEILGQLTSDATSWTVSDHGESHLTVEFPALGKNGSRKVEFRVLRPDLLRVAMELCKTGQEVPLLVLVDVACDQWRKSFDAVFEWQAKFNEWFRWQGRLRSPVIDIIDTRSGNNSLDSTIAELTSITQSGHKHLQWAELKSPTDLDLILRRAEGRRNTAVVGKKLLVGSSAAMQQALHSLEAFAHRNCPVLIAGESGTGKTAMAHHVHLLSQRCAGPFKRIDLTQTSANSFSEFLYGKKSRIPLQSSGGVIEEVEGGSLFLDELVNAAASRDYQAKLLIPIQDGEYCRVNETVMRPCNVRFIIGVNVGLAELAKMSANGEFLKDLYHRLETCRIEVPPLRRRKGDIPEFTKRILARLSLEYNQVKQLDAEVMKRLVDHNWPGNVRQLENVLERAYYLSHPETIIRVDHLEGL